MVGLAIATQMADAVAQAGDQATANLPERLQDPASVGIAAFQEIRSNWDVYRFTPEILSMHAHELRGRQ
jgi:hypothetical protein